jgi:uncharacterized membrane protein (UPF0127 family)
MRLFPARLVAALAIALPLAVTAQTAAQPKLPTVQINASLHNIHAELAQTPEQRMIGLMFRDKLGANDGMLFAFEEPATQCFWMKNTLVPLSVAYIADDGTVVNIADMAPQSLQPHCSVKPVRFALEMNQGWFSKRGIKSGFKLKGPPFSP